MPTRLDGLARRRRAARLGISAELLKARERRARERAKRPDRAWIGRRITPPAETPTSSPRRSMETPE